MFLGILLSKLPSLDLPFYFLHRNDMHAQTPGIAYLNGTDYMENNWHSKEPVYLEACAFLLKCFFEETHTLS